MHFRRPAERHLAWFFLGIGMVAAARAWARDEVGMALGFLVGGLLLALMTWMATRTLRGPNIERDARRLERRRSN